MITQSDLTWIIHSVPQFPPQKEKGYSYPTSGKVNGQSFLCLTFSNCQLRDIAEQLLYTRPYIYDNNFNNNIDLEIPELRRVFNGDYITTPPKSLKRLNSSGCNTFLIFSKSSNFKDDLYSGWLTKYFEINFYAETWRKGRHVLSSNCTEVYTVENIISMKLLDTNYKATQDHSKWAVSSDGEIFCIGGINRAKPQFNRPGGTICFCRPEFARQIKDSISKKDNCPSPRPNHRPINDRPPSTLDVFDRNWCHES